MCVYMGVKNISNSTQTKMPHAERSERPAALRVCVCALWRMVPPHCTWNVRSLCVRRLDESRGQCFGATHTHTQLTRVVVAVVVVPSLLRAIERSRFDHAPTRQQTDSNAL